MIRMSTILVVLTASLLAQPDLTIRRPGLDPRLADALNLGTLKMVHASGMEGVTATVNEFKIKPNRLLVVSKPDKSTAMFTGEVATLPVLLGRPNKKPGSADVEVTLFQIKVVGRGPFIRDGTGYACRLNVILEPLESAAGSDLPEGLDVVLDVPGGSATPGNLKFTSLRQSQFANLSVRAPGSSVAVTLKVSQVPEVTCDFAVQHPLVTLAATPPEILGYGLGTTQVLVVGDNATLPKDQIALVADQGTIDPVQVQLDDNRQALVTLRSSGKGATKVRIVGGSVASVPIEVRFRGFGVFLICAALGGLLGGVITVLRAGFWFKKAPFPWVKFLLSLFYALLGAALWALGLQVLELDWSPTWSEAAAFGVSALVALGGSWLISFGQEKKSTG